VYLPFYRLLLLYYGVFDFVFLLDPSFRNFLSISGHVDCWILVQLPIVRNHVVVHGGRLYCGVISIFLISNRAWVRGFGVFGRSAYSLILVGLVGLNEDLTAISRWLSPDPANQRQF
jgi:hypothetical protein